MKIHTDKRHFRIVAAAVPISMTVATAALQADEAADQSARGRLDATEIQARADKALPYKVEGSSGALFADTPLLETPFSMSVFNLEFIEDQRAFDLRDILDNDPSIGLQGPGALYHHAQNFSLRGFLVGNFSGYRVDGLPFINTVAPMVDDKQRVELLKGPAALRYGFMPPGGAINLVRKRPTKDFSTSIHLDADTFGRTYGQLDVSDTVAGGQFAYRLVLGGEDFDDFYDIAGGDRLFGSLFTEWKPNDALTIWSSIGYQDFSRNSYGGPLITPDGSSVIDAGLKTNHTQKWSHVDQEVFDTTLGIDFDINENWKLRSAFNYQDSKRQAVRSYTSGATLNGDFSEAAFENIDPTTWESYGAHLHLEGEFETGRLKHKMVVGGQYKTYDSAFNRDIYTPFGAGNNLYNRVRYPIPPTGPDIGPGMDLRTLEHTQEEFGFFLTDTIEFNDCWSVLLGARYGKYDYSGVSTLGPVEYPYEDSQSGWSPTAALMYSPIDNIHTYITYTQGMEDPGTADIGIQESEQWEIGVKSEWGDGRYTASLALFQIEQDQLITPGVGLDPVFDGLQRHRGVEASFAGRFTDDFRAGIGAMILDAEQVDTQGGTNDGNEPAHVPAYQVNLWVALDIPPVPGLTLTAGARFVGGQYLDAGNVVSTDDYVVLDLGARYKFQRGTTDYTVRLNIENVLDERYYETGDFYLNDSGSVAYGAPVHATLSLQIDF